MSSVKCNKPTPGILYLVFCTLLLSIEVQIRDGSLHFLPLSYNFSN